MWEKPKREQEQIRVGEFKLPAAHDRKRQNNRGIGCHKQPETEWDPETRWAGQELWGAVWTLPGRSKGFMVEFIRREVEKSIECWEWEDQWGIEEVQCIVTEYRWTWWAGGATGEWRGRGARGGAWETMRNF